MSFQKENKDPFLAKWLSDEISDNELKSLVSVKDFQAYEKIKKGLEFFETPTFEKDKLYQKISKSLLKKEKRVISLRWFSAAAAIVLIIFSSYFYYASLPTIAKTNFGEQKTIVLSDGSQAMLNSKSLLSFPKKWKNKRELTLNGEAFFKVKKGKTFRVNTSNGSVTVLGTQFNVNAQDNYFSVKCFEGKVMVIQNKDTIYLTKGKAYQNNNTKIEQWDFNNNKPSWLQGESNFKSAHLSIVIQSLENQFGIEIIENNIDTSQIFTGSFSYNDLNIALKSVFSPMNIDFTIENKKVFLLKK